MNCYVIKILVFLIVLVSCAKDWKQHEKAEFINDCINMYGTEELCGCVLGWLEKEYESYTRVLEKMTNTELDKNLKKCLKQCNQ